MLQKSFEELETREVSALNARIRGSQQANLSPWDLARRNEFPIHVEHVWQAALGSGETFYYVEAYRRYSKAAPTEGCPNISAFRGWISQDVSRAQSIMSSRIVLTDCDFKEAGFTTPLGLLELRSGTFAVVENNGWETQAYGILKLERRAMAQVIDAPVR
jgi:hypothetical protein